MKKLSRRSFVIGSGLAAAGVADIAGAGVALASESAPATDAWGVPAEWDDEADVIVCGCGTGGAPAAIEACDAGADVLVIEKADWLGGCMRRCSGGLVGVNTLVQKRLGVQDDPELWLKYLLAMGGIEVDEDLCRDYAYGCGENFDWIITPVEDGGLGGMPAEEWDFSTPEDKGMTVTVKPGLNIGGTPLYFEELGCEDCAIQRTHWFTPNPDDRDPGDRWYSSFEGEGHDVAEVSGTEGKVIGDAGSIGGGGTGLWKPFGEALDARLGNGLRIVTNTTLSSLIYTAGKEVLGVRAIDPDGVERCYKARKGVVLATGSFDNNPNLNIQLKNKEMVEPTEAYGRAFWYTPYEADGAGTMAALDLGVAPSHTGIQGMLSGGLKINTDAQMVDIFDRPVPRLYASSRLVGGIMGDINACGVLLGYCIHFGRKAGKNVAALEDWDA